MITKLHKIRNKKMDKLRKEKDLKKVKLKKELDPRIKLGLMKMGFDVKYEEEN